MGLRYPLNEPIKMYSSLWNGDNWATQEEKEKTDWSKKAGDFTLTISTDRVDMDKCFLRHNQEREIK
ncbi:hypothetical protein SUGI_0392430 [Cryptomeria japonica]|nr:hypothetical protein SUGI_0392430 [Cryptomeria japonica]